jgi:hypothetical protein
MSERGHGTKVPDADTHILGPDVPLTPVLFFVSMSGVFGEGIHSAGPVLGGRLRATKTTASASR